MWKNIGTLRITNIQRPFARFLGFIKPSESSLLQENIIGLWLDIPLKEEQEEDINECEKP